jgi:hypothetical protein
MEDETVKQYNEQANLEELIRKQQESNQGLKEQILSQDKYLQEIMNSLLQIRRKTEPMEHPETGEVYLQTFIKLEDGSGRWRKPSNLSKDQMKELKSGGIINEEGAKFIIGHLQALTNNNIALSNMSQSQINKICRDAELSLRDYLTNQREDFGITSTDAQKEIISGIVRPNMTANFSKAKNGQFVTEILREIRMVGSMDDEEEDEGVIASLK